MNREAILALRMTRLHLSVPAQPEEYDAFFRDLSPVCTAGWVEPGTPPALPGHVGFDDTDYNDARRARRAIRKGRFGGKIAYVDEADWELFACLYQKPLERPTVFQTELLELLEREGPMNIGLIKETTGLLVKAITPALHRLQEAFLVYEDQTDKEGDRGWYAMSSEYPDLNLHRYSKQEALEALLPRLCRRMVWLTAEAAHEFYAQPLSLVRKALSSLVQNGTLMEWRLDDKDGFVLCDDAPQLRCAEADAPKRGTIALQRQDPLVRCLGKEEKSALSNGQEALYYLLIDGEIRGAVCGRFKFGPHVLNDVVLNLSPSEATRRRGEILDAVYRVFDRKLSPLARYCGEPLEQDIF